MHARRRGVILKASAWLAGDIGGTHTRLASGFLGDPIPRAIQRYANADADGLDTIIDAYLSQLDARPEQACFAVAGPTDGLRARLTNLPWEIDAGRIGQRFAFEVRLINDFEAVGRALGHIPPEMLRGLQAGHPRDDAPRLALGAGTGLGVVLEAPSAHGIHVLPSEGGHIAFAPVDDEQIALLRWLRAKHGRVSVERILSGPGIVDLYAYCREAMGKPITRPRTPAEVSAAALAGDDATAVWAMRLFRDIYGQTAGDLALVARAQGGVYLAGGIAAKILPLIEDGRFMAAFRAKGRFSDWMEEVPVHVVLDPDVGLRGAALAIDRV